MKKKVCAALLSLCSVIGGAERKSDASIIGKVLKYGSAAIGSLDTLNTIVVLDHWVGLRIYELFGGPPKVNFWTAGFALGGTKEEKTDNFGNKYLVYNFIIDDRHDVRVLTPLTLFTDSLCYGGYKLGQYLDGDFNKSNANQEKKGSDKEKGKSKNDGNNGNNNSKGIGNNNLKSVKS